MAQKSYDLQWARNNLCPWCFTTGRPIGLSEEEFGLLDCPRCGCSYKWDDLAQAWDEAETYLIIRKAEVLEEVA